jgi:hypothetical protein
MALLDSTPRGHPRNRSSISDSLRDRFGDLVSSEQLGLSVNELGSAIRSAAHLLARLQCRRSASIYSGMVALFSPAAQRIRTYYFRGQI